MNKQEWLQEVARIKQQYPENLMAKHFSEEYFLGLDESSQSHLMRMVNSGVANPQSHTGAYALQAQDYQQFAPLLDPVICDTHGIENAASMVQQHNWNAKPCHLEQIDPALADVSMRVRVGRNLQGFPLTAGISQKERIELEECALTAFEQLSEIPTFAGQYFSLTPDSPNLISQQDYLKRVDARQFFKDMSGDSYLNAAGISDHWPYGRGMFVSEQEDFLVWVGEEDHLRIMTMQQGGDLNALFGRLHTGLKTLSQHLPEFSTLPNYGNVSSCPTNLGTAMRASLHLKLPHLTANGTDLSRLQEAAKPLNLAVRGAGGEHSDAGSDGLVDISPSARLGVTEADIMQCLYDGTAALWAMEKSAA